MMSLGLRGSTSSKKRGRATSSGMSLRPLLLPILLLLRRNHQGSRKNLRKVLVNSKVSMIVKLVRTKRTGKVKSLGRKIKAKTQRNESTMRSIFRSKRRSKRVSLMEGSSKETSELTLTTGIEPLYPYKASRSTS